MAKKTRNFVKEYRDRYDAAKAAGACVDPHTMVFMNQDFFFMSNEGVKKIEWCNNGDVTKW